MRTESVTVDDITVTIHSRTRRTAIIQAQYRQAIIKAHVEIAEYERAEYAIIPPVLPVDANGKIQFDKANSEQMAAFNKFSRQKMELSSLHAIGANYAKEAGNLVELLARVTSLQGTPFDLTTPPQFSDAQVLGAFEAWLDETYEDLWEAIATAIAKMDEPLTPVEQRPPETLTEAEHADPLLEPTA